MDLPENIVAGLMGLLNRTITVIEKQTELITNQLIHMANELDTYIADQTAANEKINTAVAGVTGDVKGLKKRIDDFIAGQGGVITNDQKAMLQELSGTSKAIVTKLEALDAETAAETTEGNGENPGGASDS
jgi:uncharacterized protein YoxC